MEWQPIAIAPYDRDLELAVIDRTGAHILVFPCHRIPAGWLKSGTNQWVDVHPNVMTIGPGGLSDEYVHAYGRKVREIMTSDQVIVTDTTPLSEIVDILESRHVKRVPVVRGGKLIGIVSRANLVQALARLLPHATDASPTYTEIRRRILDEIDNRPWSPGNSVDVRSAMASQNCGERSSTTESD